MPKKSKPTKVELLKEIEALQNRLAELQSNPPPRAQLQEEFQDALAYAESILDTAHESLIVLDADLRVLRANTAFYCTFKATPAETEGKFIYQLGNGQWNIPQLRDLLERIIP